MIFEVKSPDATEAANTGKSVMLPQITPGLSTGVATYVNGSLINSIPAWCVLPGSTGDAAAPAAFEKTAIANRLAQKTDDAQGEWMRIANLPVNSLPGHLGSLLPSPAVIGPAIGPMAVASGAVMGGPHPQIGSAPGIWAAANQYKDGRPVSTTPDAGRSNCVLGTTEAGVPAWQILPFGT
ncbi:hypothetical protein UAJ10_05075 [Nitrospirillum sp. BR 11164]|uniref:hypothetical protein n=1 Tax=Nitrospirillum sp. BR 11164 TaxID=3104324 RepID=UPI002AFEABF4|nr:hypothetical protein [Nitrospirillum sp. BR 11164]MEA1648390.1 hypothetical protein [Nitrospirillum sp. BR 11164]